MRRATRSLIAGGLGLSLVAGDVAAAATCFTLQAELTHLQSQTGGGSGDRERYERAYREQIEVIARTEARARDAGCFGGGFVFFRQDPDPACATMVPKLREMQVNLGRLDRLRMSGNNGNAERINEVQAMLADRGCGLPGSDEWGEGNEWTYDLDNPYVAAGMFRTLCVRTCDGYYFPISYSTGPEQFPADAQTCSAMCPGTEARLYYYPNPGGRPEEMTSIEGSSYSDLPTAFLYRTRVEPACACGPASGSGLFADAGAEAGGEASDPTAPLPRARPAPGEDPETLANRAGNFVPRIGSGTALASADVTTTTGGRDVRIVGPVFGVSPEQQEALVIPIPEEPPAEN